MDFLIIYEHATRELESACYLASILKQKGYSVKVINERYIWRVFLRPKVVVVPYLYSSEDVESFNTFLLRNKINIVNLQHEQMLNDVAIKTGFHIPKGKAASAIHICWGNNTYNRLYSAGIQSKNLPITGNIGMDMNRPEMKKYLISKECIATQFGLSENKHWHLFMSSFVLDSLTKEEVKDIETKLEGYGEFVEVSRISKLQVVSWLLEFAKENPEKEIIYRPHPAEKVNNHAEYFKNLPSNFHIIRDYSIRQWVSVADSFSTWFSTSIIDCYFANKPCCILRPVGIPQKFDEKIFLGGNFITSYLEFSSYMSLTTTQSVMPISEKEIEVCYGKKVDIIAGEKVARICENALVQSCQYKHNYFSIFNCMKLDVIAAVFRLFPNIGANSKRFYSIRKKALASASDYIKLNQYLKTFSQN